MGNADTRVRVLIYIIGAGGETSLPLGVISPKGRCREATEGSRLRLRKRWLGCAESDEGLTFRSAPEFGDKQTLPSEHLMCKPH